MKMKISLTLSMLSLLLLSGFLVYNQNVLANYLTKETTKPKISYEDYSQMEKKSDRNMAFQKETPERNT
jgi:hypothetical protein